MRSSIPDSAGPQPLRRRLVPRASRQQLPRGCAPLLVLLALAGCATTAPPAAGGAPQAEPAILILRQEGCCAGELQQSARALVEALARRAALREGQAAAAPASPPAPATEDPGSILTEALTQATRAYLAMQMDQARQLLTRALERARLTAAKGLRPELLAQLHLLLVAVGDAQRREELVRRHSELAVGFNPELAPHADIFPPTVRQAIERARRQLERVEVVVRTIPGGATISWDGKEQGPGPVRLPDQPRGRHYLLVEHPLCQPRQEVIHLSTAAELKVELSPAPAEHIFAVAAAHPKLRPVAAQLLGVKAIIWLTAPQDQMLVIECAGPQGGQRRLELTPSSPSLAIEQAAETCLKSAGAAVASSAGTATAATRPASAAPTRAGHFRRYWWAWAAAGALALSAGITLPLVLGGEAQAGRPVQLELP